MAEGLRPDTLFRQVVPEFLDPGEEAVMFGLVLGLAWPAPSNSLRISFWRLVRFTGVPNSVSPDVVRWC